MPRSVNVSREFRHKTNTRYKYFSYDGGLNAQCALMVHSCGVRIIRTMSLRECPLPFERQLIKCDIILIGKHGGLKFDSMVFMSKGQKDSTCLKVHYVVFRGKYSISLSVRTV